MQIKNNEIRDKIISPINQNLKCNYINIDL